MDAVPLLAATYYLAGIMAILVAFFFESILGLCNHGKTLAVAQYHSHQSLSVAKRKFIHFYFLGIAANIFLLLKYGNPLTLMLLVHLQRRYFESLFIMPSSDKSSMHLLHYLAGITFYPVTGLVAARVPTPKLHFSAIACFIALSTCQLHAHYVLGRARRVSASYRPLPSTLMFKYMLCPHYLCEICFYLGLALVHASSDTLLCLAFVSTNICVSGHQTKLWYRKQFGPDKRWAVVPFIL